MFNTPNERETRVAMMTTTMLKRDSEVTHRRQIKLFDPFFAVRKPLHLEHVAGGKLAVQD
jgi:hypothetical protein